MNQFEITVQPEQKSERIDKFWLQREKTGHALKCEQWVKEDWYPLTANP